MEMGLPAMLAHDLNVMPTERDAHGPDRWIDYAFFAPEVRDAFFRLTGQGLCKAVRAVL